MSYFKKYYGLFMILALCLFIVHPLFISGFFSMHDDTQPSRVFEMANSLKNGIIPVRWSSNLGYGYGYPIFNFYGPFVYYIGGLINTLGIDVIVATKVMMLLGMITAGVSMYFLSREFWSEGGGVVSGILYSFAPYHALNLYVRGDVAEMYAYAVIPLIFLSIYKIWHIESKNLSLNKSQRPYEKNNLERRKLLWLWVILGSLSYAIVIMSHNLTALMVSPFLAIGIVSLCVISYFRFKNLRSIYYVFFIILLGILLSAFYWFPALNEMEYTNVMSQIGGKADFRLHFVCIGQLWDSPWGFGGSAPGCVDGMSFRVGKLHVVLAILTVFLVPFIWKKDKNFSLLAIGLFILLCISVWLMMEPSRLVWEYIPIMKFFQYPWRFLLMVTFLVSFLGGSIIFFIRIITNDNRYHKYIDKIIIILLIFVAFVLYGKLFNPQTIIQKSSNDYISETALKWNISKISDEYMPTNFMKPKNEKDIVRDKISIVNGAGSVTNEKQGINYLEADLTIEDNPALVLIKTAYFPAWNLYLNNLRSNYTITNKGILIDVPEGKNNLALRFEQTQIERLGNIITLTGIFILVLGIIVTYLVPASRIYLKNKPKNHI